MFSVLGAPSLAGKKKVADCGLTHSLRPRGPPPDLTFREMRAHSLLPTWNLLWEAEPLPQKSGRNAPDMQAVVLTFLVIHAEFLILL